MSTRARLDKLEAEAGDFYSTLRLPDGTMARHTGEEMLGAVSATIRQRAHWLLPHVRKVDTRMGMPGLIRALEDSRRG